MLLIIMMIKDEGQEGSDQGKGFEDVGEKGKKSMLWKLEVAQPSEKPVERKIPTRDRFLRTRL